jgi:DHA1 family bicyclomycin/chloramphenicol resistance-like MFS transporter
LYQSKPAIKGQKYSALILVLGALSAIGPFSIDMYLPGFRAIADDLKTDIAHVGFSLTSYFVGISAGQLLYGPLMDRFGRKKPLMFGLIAYIAAALGCAFSPSISLSDCRAVIACPRGLRGRGVREGGGA